MIEEFFGNYHHLSPVGQVFVPTILILSIIITSWLLVMIYQGLMDEYGYLFVYVSKFFRTVKRRFFGGEKKSLRNNEPSDSG